MTCICRGDLLCRDAARLRAKRLPAWHAERRGDFRQARAEHVRHRQAAGQTIKVMTT
jgi:hypothetical protein